MSFRLQRLRGMGKGLLSSNGVPMLSLPQNLTTTPGALFEDFEAIGDWTAAGAGGAAAANVTEYKTGTQSIKVTSVNAVACTITKTINRTFGAGERRWRFWLYLHDDLAKVADAYIYITSLTNFATKSFNFPLSNYGLQVGWNEIIIPETGWVGASGESWDNNMIRIMFRVKALAGQTVSMSFDGLTVGENGYPGVAFTFDDGLDSQHAKAFAIMRPHRVRGTVYCITNNLNNAGALTDAQVQEMYAAGWDMANHTASHAHLTTGGLNQAQIQAELTTAQAALEALGCARSALHVAYPWGEYDATVGAVMTAVGAQTGRTTEQAYVMIPSMRIYQITTNLINNADSLASVKTVIDTAILRGNIACLCFHGIADAPGVDEWSTANLTALVEYIATKNIAVLTMDDIYRSRSGGISVPRQC